MEPHVKVLFLPGIEARGWPLKAELIASLHGVAVHCPNLGSADWMRRIWVVAAMLILVYLGTAALVVWLMIHHAIHVGVGVALLLAVLLILWKLGMCVVRLCLRRAYDEATDVAAKTIEVLRPDVIVGQSFGAVVALRLKPEVPLLLLSCARRYFCEWAGVPLPECSGGMPVAVVHGTEDDLCPLSDAEDLVRTAKAEAWLVAREGEGHMLPGLGVSGLAEVLRQLTGSYLPEEFMWHDADDMVPPRVPTTTPRFGTEPTPRPESDQEADEETGLLEPSRPSFLGRMEPRAAG